MLVKHTDSISQIQTPDLSTVKQTPKYDYFCALLLQYKDKFSAHKPCVDLPVMQSRSEQVFVLWAHA